MDIRQTNRNLLKEVALRARRPRKVFKMSDRHRAARMALARRRHLLLKQAMRYIVVFVN